MAEDKENERQREEAQKEEWSVSLTFSGFFGVYVAECTLAHKRQKSLPTDSYFMWQSVVRHMSIIVSANWFIPTYLTAF
jgi:hypothetical protein